MMTEAEDLASAICVMLRQRAYRGNSQSKHGIQAAYEMEQFELVDALDDWLTRRARMKALGVNPR